MQPSGKGKNVYILSIYMTKMAAMHTYSKTLKTFSSEPLGLETWFVTIRNQVLKMLYK